MYTPATKIKLTAKGKTYTPKASNVHQHQLNWQALTKALGKGPRTYGQLCALQSKLPALVQTNHAPYIRYAVKSGWLAIVGK